MIFLKTNKQDLISKVGFSLPILIVFFFMFSIVGTTTAQETVISSGEYGVIHITDVPPNPEPGKCYSKCLIKNSDGQYSEAEWKEIVCPKYLTSKVVKKVKKELRKNGYPIPKSEKDFGNKTKDALTAYQKAKALPIGNLDFETIAALGVKIKS